MKKLAPYLLGLALLAFIGGKNALDFYNEKVYLAKSDGYAQARAKYAPKAPAVSEQIAKAICAGQFATDAASLFDPSMGVTQAELDAFTTNAQSQGRRCTEATYLGSVQHDSGARDDLYRIVTDKASLWYAITVDNNLVTNIQ